MSQPDTPNIRMRAGSDGPFVDLGWQLRNLSKNVQVRRLFFDEDAGSYGVAAGTAVPGTEVAGVDVEWSADDAAITAQLNYAMWGSFQFGPVQPGSPTAYPGPVQLTFNVTPAGGISEIVRSVTTRAIPLNPGVDFTFWGDVATHNLSVALSFTNFVQGTNRIWLGAANPNAGSIISVSKGCLLVAELASQPASISVE